MNIRLLTSALTGAVLAAAMGLAPALAHADGVSPKVIKKVPPEFPSEAQRRGVTEGVLKAKLSIDGSGSVTEVAILEATPARAKVFNESATAALNQWKFEANGKPQSFEMKLVFAME